MILYILTSVIRLLQLIIVIQALLTWLPFDESLKAVYKFFNKITGPLMDFTYKITGNKLIFNGIDFTPMVLIVALGFLNKMIVRLAILGSF